MPDSIDIRIDGLDALKAKLDDLSKEAGDRAIRKALKAGAVVEQAAITEAAPVKDTTGGMLLDGALKSDITITMKTSSAGEQYAVVKPGKYTFHVATWIEYGHRLITGGYSILSKKTGKTRGPGTQIGTVPAHPFIRPAFESSRTEVIEATTSTLKTEIEKEAKKK